MNRLNDMQDMYLQRRIANLEAKLIDLKLTPQPTSNKSGVKTYLNPKSTDWQSFEYTDYNGVVTTTDTVNLPATSNVGALNNLDVTCEFRPLNQDCPIVIPYLDALLNNSARLQPSYNPNFGVCMVASAGQASLLANSELNYQNDLTNYSLQKPVYRWKSSFYWETPPGQGISLKFRFFVRSTDKGQIRMLVKSYRYFT